MQVDNGKSKRKLSDRSPQVESGSIRMRMGSEEVSGMDYCEKLQGIIDDVKVKVGTTLTAMELAGETPTASEFKTWIGTMVGTLMNGMDCSFSVVSDMAMEISVVRETLRKKEAEVKEMKDAIRDQDSVVKEVAKAKDRVEIKASAREMEDKLRISTTQFKVMDLDFGKETEDRKEIVSLGVAEIRKKIRNDHVGEFDELIKHADVAPLTRKTFKATNKNYFSAPLLFTVQDKAKRWKLEDILRGSKVYPGFHWPQEMINPIKEYRRILKEEGRIDEETTYVRIRPVERDGRLRIKADTKEKTSTGRFVNRQFYLTYNGIGRNYCPLRLFYLSNTYIAFKSREDRSLSTCSIKIVLYDNMHTLCTAVSKYGWAPPHPPPRGAGEGET